MKTQQTIETRNAVRWGKAVGFGIAIGTVFGTVVGVATKNSVFVYIGMLLGAAIGAIRVMDIVSDPTLSPEDIGKRADAVAESIQRTLPKQ